jgi:hypothetical protein
MRKKGFRRIDKDVENGTHEIKQYTKRMVRKVHYRILPTTQEDLDFLKESFPDFLANKGLKKLIPNATIEGDSIIYDCPKRPKVYFDVREGTIRVPSADYQKYKDAWCNNQAHFAVRQIKDCSDYYEIKYFEIHYLPRKLRKGQRGDWNLWKG